MDANKSASSSGSRGGGEMVDVGLAEKRSSLPNMSAGFLEGLLRVDEVGVTSLVKPRGAAKSGRTSSVIGYEKM